MATQKQRAKRKEQRQRKLNKDQKPEELDTDTGSDLFVGGDIEKSESPEEVEQVEKDYEMVMVAPGPTSYDEMDAMREAEEKARQVNREAWTVQDLVYNITRAPMSPDEKGKAISKVGKDFGKRLNAIANDKISKEYDLDLLQLKAILGRDSRHTSLLEKAISLFSSNPKTELRKQLKLVADELEKNPEIQIRNKVPDLVKSAREIGLGGDSPIIIEKDLDGNWRAVLMVSNNFKDRDGEFLSQAAHEEYVEWVNKNLPDAAPVFATWHVPGTARTHPIDFVGYENGFLVESCLLTQEEAASILKMQETTDVGLSIGGIALRRDPENTNVILKYRQFEVSDLPLSRAANPFTDIQIVSKEADMDSKGMLQYLTGMVGEERAKGIVSKMALSQEELRKAGVEEKEKKEEAPAAKAEAAPPAVDLEQIVERVAKEFGMEELSSQFAAMKEATEKVPVLEELVKQLLTSKEEQLAEMIQPAVGKQFAWMEKRASQSAETVLKEGKEEDEKLKKSAPEVGWLSQATNTTPVVVQ